MRIVILVLVLALVLVGGLLYERHTKKKRALVILQNKSRNETKTVVKGVFEQTLEELDFQRIIKSPLTLGQDVNQVWGAGVLVYEFECQVKENFDQQLFFEVFKEKLRQAGKKKFVLTDFWLRDQVLHLDVAEIKNDDTKAYIRDINKVE